MLAVEHMHYIILAVRKRKSSPQKAKVVEIWFKRTIDLLMQHLKSLLAEPKLKLVQTIILLGSFGESAYVQERVRNEIADVRLIVPSDAGLAVLKDTAPPLSHSGS
ncbi:HS12A-like protein [Mya arenaria]|uniref:HS12A-like protein n=1 Tax=Mya arenaria TaxID=6604 RepID=A0ABY7EVS5_MYAAR|nr:HS12A-like protein [Mya arenaria]